MRILGFSNKGKKLTEEQRQRAISASKKFWFKKGNKFGRKYKFKKGHITWSQGKKLDLEIRKKMSIAKRGDKCHLWRGGITEKNQKIKTSIEYRLWRESVFARDNWTCQKCENNKGGNLNSHHIINFANFPSLRFAIDNGITLCDKCHIKFHKKYGIKNNTKEQLLQWLMK